MSRRMLILVLLVAAMVLPMAVGHGEATYFNAEGYPICDEVIELDFAFYAPADNTDWESRVMVTKFREDFGIQLNCTGLSSREDLTTQMTLWLASDTLPDLIGGARLSATDVADWGQQGYLLAWNEYFDLMPNLMQVFEAYPEYRSYLTAPDGNIYGFSQVEANITGRISRVWINKNWLAAVDMDVPATVDELYEVLKAFRDNDANENGDPNDEIPYGYSADTHSDRMLLAAFGLLTSEPNYILSVNDAGEVVFDNIGDNYREYLRYMRMLYAEGLMDPEFYLKDANIVKERIAGNTYGFFGASAPFAMGGFDIAYDANFAWVGGLTSAYNDTPFIPLTNVVGSDVVVLASAATKYPEAIARMLDWCFSEEGEVALQRGWEGETFSYDYVESLDGYVATLFKPEGYNSTEEYKLNAVLVSDTLGPLASRANGTQYRLIQTASDENIFDQDDALLRYGWAVLVERGRRAEGMVEAGVFPQLVYTNDEAAARSTLLTDVANYIATARAQFIIGEMDIETQWDAYVSRLNQMRLEELLAIEQAAYDRYIAN